MQKAPPKDVSQLWEYVSECVLELFKNLGNTPLQKVSHYILHHPCETFEDRFSFWYFFLKILMLPNNLEILCNLTFYQVIINNFSSIKLEIWKEWDRHKKSLTRSNCVVNTVEHSIMVIFNSLLSNENDSFYFLQQLGKVEETKIVR